MKTFKQFCESVKPFPTSPPKLTPGKGYPLGVPFINLKKDMENKIFKWQTSKLSDDDINKLDEEVNSLIEESVDQAKKSPLPSPEDVTTDVYVSY